MNESCHIYEWAMSHVWMSHITCMNESCQIYEWVMSRIWMSHVTCINGSSHTYERVMSHIWMSHVTYMNESCRICPSDSERDTCGLRRVTRMTKTCHTYEWEMSHIWWRHVTHIKKACHTYEWGMSHVWMSHVTSGSQTQSETHVVWGVSCGWDMSQRERVMSHINGSCQIQMCLVTYECHVCDTSHVWTRRSTARWSRVTFKWVMSHMWHVTRAVEAWHTEKELPAKFKWMGHVTCECVVSESGPWEWGLLYWGPAPL